MCESEELEERVMFIAIPNINDCELQVIATACLQVHMHVRRKHRK